MLASPRRARSRTPEAGPRGRTMARVFVVDDDPSVRRALKRLIRAAGFSVEVFATAAEFLALERTPGRQCLVLDIRLDGMSGIELQRRLLESSRTLPIVFITGHGSGEVREAAIRAGAVDFLAKPFDEGALLDAIRRALEPSSFEVVM